MFTRIIISLCLKYKIVDLGVIDFFGVIYVLLGLVFIGLEFVWILIERLDFIKGSWGEY